MPWFAKSGNTTGRHVLRSDKSQHLWPEGHVKAYAESMCGVQLDVESTRDDARSSCLGCHTLYDTENGISRRTQRGGNAKLPRCTCPDCGGVHIKERDHVQP